MKDVPLVSIFCITFNHAKYIRLCLDSFIMQKTNFPFEVLIHDDASTDGTQDIIMEYQQKFPEIIKPIYQKENQWSKGVNVAEFNFERVKGKYVALCEGDDYWTDENKLQIQVDFMENNPEHSICFHPVDVIYEDNSTPRHIFPSPEIRFNKEVLNIDDLLRHNFIQTNSVMYRWPFFGKEYKAFTPDDILPGDWYCHLFHAQFGSIGFIDKCMSVYYRHSEGMWTGNNLLKHGIKHIKCYVAILENIATNKEYYLHQVLMPNMKNIYATFKEHGDKEGILFIESNKYWITVQKPSAMLSYAVKNITLALQANDFAKAKWFYEELKRQDFWKDPNFAHVTQHLEQQMISIGLETGPKNNGKQCYICKKTFPCFGKYMGGSANVSPWLKNLNLIGSDVDNFSCPFCSCHDRERHIFAYFDKLNLWPNKSSKILHFAPETHLLNRLELCNPAEYIKADWMPEAYINRGVKDCKKINLMEIPFADNYFDLVICNHILEHVPDIQKGIAEVHRVLKPGGFAILQTPFSQLLHRHFEDAGITTEEQREFFYGQNDHVRIVSERQFFGDLENQGFNLAFVKHDDLFDSDFAKIYGVNSKEDLIRVVKI